VKDVYWDLELWTEGIWDLKRFKVKYEMGAGGELVESGILGMFFTG